MSAFLLLFAQVSPPADGGVMQMISAIMNLGGMVALASVLYVLYTKDQARHEQQIKEFMAYHKEEVKNSRDECARHLANAYGTIESERTGRHVEVIDRLETVHDRLEILSTAIKDFRSPRTA